MPRNDRNSRDVLATQEMPRLAIDTALARKIAVVLVIKVCFLIAIRQLWFSNPQAVDMKMPTRTVEMRMFGDGTAAN